MSLTNNVKQTSCGGLRTPPDLMEHLGEIMFPSIDASRLHLSLSRSSAMVQMWEEIPRTLSTILFIVMHVYEQVGAYKLSTILSCYN